jgi:[ribosomal protein S5]-alanine N-acetyltransferase
MSAQPPRLVGEFVALRPLRPEDAPITHEWRKSARARLLNVGAPDIDAQERWIASRPASERNEIIETLDGHPLGMLSLVDIDLTHRHAETARFLIGDEEAAKGIPAAVEAMKLLYELAFDELGLVRIYGTVAESNARMIKWQRYLGMVEEGRLRRHLFIDGTWQDAVCLGLLDEEYRSVSLPRMNALISAARRT